MATELGLDGEYAEDDLPLLIQRRGMAVWEGDVVRILDRRELPHAERILDCRSVEDVAHAIEDMAIQGAFTLALAAGYGVALHVNRSGPGDDLLGRIDEAVRRLQATRPTGLALSRMLMTVRAAGIEALSEGRNAAADIAAAVDSAAMVLTRQALATARNALATLGAPRRLLTHCFADRSILYLLLEAQRAGIDLELFASETRPFLQGARLTAYSAAQIGVPVTLLTDGMGGALMRDRKIDALVTGADLVCMNGTVCNKIGTYQFALAAKANNVPYLVLRQSGPDTECLDETDIEIEYRDPQSVLEWRGVRVAPAGVNAIYPAFDITPPELVSHIATDRGVFSPFNIGDYSETEVAFASPW